MAVREELIDAAVTFLQDPSVANAPVDKKIAFLQTKNLTKEEVDVALARSGESGAVAAAAPANYGYQQPVNRQPVPYGYPQPPYGQSWQQPPPVPQRDWRDYFIMATVMSGLSYGAYFVAKRYIAPLIAPPTPPQLEQDKAAVDESFARAFDLIEQLSTDTAAIKASEESRKERLDTALTDMEAAIQELKQASRRRDDDTRRIGDEVRNLQSAIPKAIKTTEENTDIRMRELSTELRSLKTLLSSRVPPAANASPIRSSTPVPGNAPPPTTAPPAASVNQTTDGAATNGASTTRFAGAKTGIPAWQMAASKANDAEQKKDTSESGTVTESST